MPQAISDQQQDTVEPVSTELFDKWATDPDGPVALHLKQKLLPVESVNGDEGIAYPPTYADIGYNIDTLSDGTKVALIDSVGSQANRIEPIFWVNGNKNRENWLVPQIEIILRTEKCGECQECKNGKACKKPRQEKRSLLDLAHRSADAVVQSCPDLMVKMGKAFETLRRTGDARPLCVLAPTSLVFGVWDSRGGTGEKRPRLVRAIIRAWDVEPLHAAAQYNSVWKALDEKHQVALKTEAKTKKAKLSEKGLADAPAVFRKTDKIPKFRDGAPNSEARVLGGVLVRGRIEREVTVNLVALRGLRGSGEGETEQIRKYLLGLSLLAATADIDLFLREGCHLRYVGEDTWHSIPRRGRPSPVKLGADQANLIKTYASERAVPFRNEWPEQIEYAFDLNEAKKLLAKKDDDTPDGE